MKLFNTLIAGGLLTISFLVIPGATKAQTFQEKVAEKAVKEWQNFHNPPIVVRAKADTEIRRDTGTAERPLEYAQCNIVNRYWRSVKTPPRGDFCGSSLLFMLNQHTRCQDNILLTQKFRKFLKP